MLWTPLFLALSAQPQVAITAFLGPDGPACHRAVYTALASSFKVVQLYEIPPNDKKAFVAWLGRFEGRYQAMMIGAVVQNGMALQLRSMSGQRLSSLNTAVVADKDCKISANTKARMNAWLAQTTPGAKLRKKKPPQHPIVSLFALMGAVSRDALDETLNKTRAAPSVRARFFPLVKAGLRGLTLELDYTGARGSSGEPMHYGKATLGYLASVDRGDIVLGVHAGFFFSLLSERLSGPAFGASVDASVLGGLRAIASGAVLPVLWKTGDRRPLGFQAEAGLAYHFNAHFSVLAEVTYLGFVGTSEEARFRDGGLGGRGGFGVRY